MDTTPIYELRERLRAAAMAGTSLLAEDFRLRRVCETFKPLAAASPVFAKIEQLTEQLLSPDISHPQGALLDAVSLTDAVICTLGAVDVAGEITPLEIVESEETADAMIVNAPYSVLKELLEGLEGTGGACYRIREEHPALFRDYRVKYALVQALGASYAEFANDVAKWLCEDKDKSILPLLYRDFDPAGKREMVRRVEVIEAVAGADANDFYIKMLDTAQKEVRQALIFALRHHQDNVPLLLEMTKKERGKNKDAAFWALANIENAQAAAYFKKYAEKNPKAVLGYLTDASSEWAAEVVEELCDRVLEQIENINEVAAEEKDLSDVFYLLHDLLRALYGKGGAHGCECYRKLLRHLPAVNALFEKRKKQHNPVEKIMWRLDFLQSLANVQYLYPMGKFISGLGLLLMQSLVVNPDADLQALALELYQADAYFLPAAVMTKLLNDEDCADWLEAQLIDQRTSKIAEKRMRMILEAVGFICWDKLKGAYELFGSSRNSDILSVRREIQVSHAANMLRWLMRHPSHDTDAVLTNWIPLNDEGLCREAGAYFYQRALTSKDTDSMYLINWDSSYSMYLINCMKDCNWNVCKGLGVKFVKEHLSFNANNVYVRLIRLPGDKDAIMEEMREICTMVRSGALKADRLKPEELEASMEDWYRRN
ncbi:MAG: hypothetical protein K1W08_10005 [Lachnospiraceae bacterium]